MTSKRQSKRKVAAKRHIFAVYFRSQAELALVKRAAELRRRGTSSYIADVSLQQARADLKVVA